MKAWNQRNLLLRVIRTSRRHFKRLNHGAKSSVHLIRSQMISYLKAMISGILVAMTSPTMSEIKVTVDLVTPLLLPKQSNQDSSLNMVRKYHRFQPNRS
jgi:hypothetical protein